MITKMNKFLFMPTFRCQLECHYCQYKVSTKENPEIGYPQIKAFEHRPNVGPELSADEWLSHLERFRPYFLEISGGEPTMYKDLPELISKIPDDCIWAMTSNTLRPDIIETLDFSKCVSWTSSYHHRLDEKFIQGLVAVVKKSSRRVIPAVTFVVTPQNWEAAIKKLFEFMGHGVRVNVHPLFANEFSWKEHPEMKGALDVIRLMKQVNFVEQDWKSDLRYTPCRAGHNYFYLMPDGQVLRCYSHGFKGHTIGHVSTFEPYKGLEACDVDCLFPCDREIAKSPDLIRDEVKA